MIGASQVVHLVRNPPVVQGTSVPFLGWEVLLEKGGYSHQDSWASLVIQIVKNPPAMRETWIRFQGREDPLEEGMATHSGILAWRIPMDRGAWRAAGHGVTKSQTRPSD